MKMSQKLYTIDTTLFHPNNGAILKDTSIHKELFRFFKMNLGDEEKIKKIKIEFIAREGYTLKNIEKTDFIFTFSALLFSKRFVDKIGEILEEEMHFFPCKVICEDVSLDWYATKITNLFPIVDESLSTYEVSDGEKVLEWAKYRTDIEEKFYIAKDHKEMAYFVVTDLFKNLCDKNELKIVFKEV